ncbi:MBL fold metallo-hydrolase [Chondromyces crocatus]|uniref:Metallo-beta-lactamase domain-containing protein n=1 Tax=Chondromyces crocatus TaxID=52 RepID=A0A0K1E8A5_CHOCO|nr:MBL fold metallo-hydrolase [Chondromyces crocatus]AKT36927.1 uncharacterized protein CMC5_010480 [Chondromyces crocatus]
MSPRAGALEAQRCVTARVPVTLHEVCYTPRMTRAVLAILWLLPSLALVSVACGGSEHVTEVASVSSTTSAPGVASRSAPAAVVQVKGGEAAGALPASAEGLPETKLSEDLVIRQLAPDVHLITHTFPWPANALLVEMANGDLVLCDPTYTVDAMRLVLAWMDERYGKRRIVALNTHFHIDRVGGNAALLERGIPVYGSDLTARLVTTRSEAHRAWVRASVDDGAIAAVFETQPMVPPDRVFPIAEGLSLTFGEEKVVVHHPGPGHAPDNVVVFFPAHRLLFGGCLVAAGERIGNTTDGDLARWGDAIRDLQRFKAFSIVPGHGSRLDPGLLDHTLALLASASP